MGTLSNRSTGVGSKPALLIIDASVAFTDPACPLGASVDAEVAAIGRLLGAFREKALPVMFTTNAYHDAGEASVFREKVPALNLLQAGCPLVEIDPRLAPRAGESIVTKALPSAFFDTPLRRLLRKEGVDSVFVAGFTTSGCVRATAVDALQCNLRVIVPREAVGDRDAVAHAANLHDLGLKYADVVGLEQAIALLETVRTTAI